MGEVHRFWWVLGLKSSVDLRALLIIQGWDVIVKYGRM